MKRGEGVVVIFYEGRRGGGDGCGVGRRGDDKRSWRGKGLTVMFEDIKYKVTVKGKKHPIAEKIGFVLQDDIVFPHLTVKEILTYAALLCLPNTLTQEQKDRATHVITELGLERCQVTIIGGPFVKGISGGERKRLCIGNEILLNPSLLFLDEILLNPSLLFLDSTTALRIVQVLHSIAEAGKTIHQPSSRLFSKFDKLNCWAKEAPSTLEKPRKQWYTSLPLVVRCL
ncbi:hypothetical protein HYC85_007947 [Camellia sinensis]|uniref:ABC transporter domain-containing protein n=1 Tax=Camellia sinensis TaxID=4442 RepID=A0A7J7HS92_CAMSI|nr:hypothetical protein HYC85_007947 [Camellia sinensis]